MVLLLRHAIGMPGSRRGAPLQGASLLRALSRLEREGGTGDLALDRDGEEVELHLSSLDKPFFPGGLTKGDLLRYYVRVAPLLLPLIAGRPLALRRHPDGALGEGFFQHAPRNAPAWARVEEVETEEKGRQPRLVGGDLPTLLWAAQTGVVAVNAWHSRVGSLERPDYMVLDLDPGEGVTFATVVRVARIVHESLERHALVSLPKTSGSRGIHMMVPLAEDASYDSSARLAEEVATEVARAHPEVATVERAIGDRPAGTVYVDHMQNAHGKTLASALSARPRAGATVSMPLRWADVGARLDASAFTIVTVPKRLARAERALLAAGMPWWSP